jgi:hypothetical protein
MQSLKLLLVLALMLTFNLLNAQFSSGTKSFFGEAQIGLTSKTPKISNEISLNTTSLKLSPGFGTFSSDKVLYFGQVIINSEANTQKYGGSEITRSSTQLGTLLGARFYFTNDKKANFYAQMESSFLRVSSTYDGRDEGQVSFLIPAFGLGTNIKINNTNAINFRLAYSRYFALGDNSGSVGLLTLGGGLESFLSSDYSEDETIGLTDAGRNVVDGSLLLALVLGDNQTVTSLSLTPQYAHFVAKNVLLGLRMNVDIQDQRDARLSFQPSVRYYVPLSKRFFVYPSAGLSFRNFQQLSLAYTGDFKLNYEFGLGLSYFLRRNLALEANVLNYAIETDNTNFFAGLNVGLKYFIH